MEVRSEDSCILIDGAVLDDYLVKLLDIHDILETLVKEIYLKIK